MLHEKIKIIGIGNVLCGDDALGVQVINRLMTLALPNNVALVHGETDAWFCLEEALTASYVIVIDSIFGNQGPEKVYKIDFSELGNRTDPFFGHDTSLIELIAFFNAKGENIQGVIIGIECNTIEIGFGLNAIVEGKICLVVNKILESLESLPC